MKIYTATCDYCEQESHAFTEHRLAKLYARAHPCVGGGGGVVTITAREAERDDWPYGTERYARNGGDVPAE